MNIKKLIKEKINEFQKIIIHSHLEPDGDSFGSQWALKRIIEKNWENKVVYNCGDSNYIEIDKNIVQVNLNEEDYKNALVIVCDTANRERINGKYWKKGKIIIKIDHHPIIDNYGDINLIDEKASSTGEMIANWAYDNSLIIDEKASFYLYLSIVSDTNRFSYNISSKTFEIVKKLFQTKFNYLKLYKKLYVQTLSEIKFLSFIFKNFKIFKNKVGYIILKKEEINFFKIKEEKVSFYLKYFNNNKDFNIWVFFIEKEKKFKKIKVSVRSNYYQINNILKKYNGGGLKFASGCFLYNEEECWKLLNDLSEIKKENE